MKKLQYIIGNEQCLQEMSAVRAWKPFEARAINFCNELSAALLKLDDTAAYSDLIALAFWLRKNNLQRISQQYNMPSDRLGKGLVFHIAPGNVPLSFAYSLATGLLTGNTNVIRLSSRRFEQAEIFCSVLRKLLSNAPEISQRLCLIRYPHDRDITDELSAMCHIRIIWGGDATVNTIRRSPIPPRATEITFANRFSICLIDADKYLSDYNPKKTAHDFFIDTYLTDQNACSSPRIVFWLGTRKDEAKQIFWRALHNEIHDYNLASVTTVDKLLTFCKFAAENACRLMIEDDFKIMRVAVEKPSAAMLENIGSGGYFYECDIAETSDILPICTWELQTISYIGADENKLQELVLSNAPDGVDRIVPVGRTMEFNFVWDGRDVITEMTRRIVL